MLFNNVYSITINELKKKLDLRYTTMSSPKVDPGGKW